MEFRRFLYWFPGVDAPTDEVIGRCGLTEVLPPACALMRRGATGPDGERGVVCGLAPPRDATEQAFGYYPESQTWRACDGRAWWLGVATGAAPRPEDLERPKQVRGHDVRLGDGRAWRVPVAKRFDLQTGRHELALPQGLDLSEDGKWIARPLPAFVALSERVERAWSDYARMLEGPVEVDAELWLGLAVEALTLNYHVGRWEAATLGVLSTSVVHDVVEAVLDVPTLRAAADGARGKKADGPPGGSSTACGERGG
ncbi:MAG TPA: hypothetical protein PLE19_12725 [Planctomycetota bacterium]|nr:hypothetical protein [Planctomycetota bacterium]HRT95521.1 hypothetical protein [Planctomycetota bacterium]